MGRAAGLNKRLWNQARTKAKDRDGWRCVKCGKAGRLEVDHIQPLCDGGGKVYDLSNLQTLCRGCHIKKSRIEREERRPEYVPKDADKAAWKTLVDALTD